MTDFSSDFGLRATAFLEVLFRESGLVLCLATDFRRGFDCPFLDTDFRLPTCLAVFLRFFATAVLIQHVGKKILNAQGANDE
jgi:hypothetical protein